MTVRRSPSLVSKLRDFSRPVTITRVPRCSDSATFSAASRQMLQRRKSVSPSFHSFACRSNVRGVDATVKFATAAPLGVNRSSGSLVMFPPIVMSVSPAMNRSLLFGQPRSAAVEAQHLRPQHRLAELQLPVELLDRGGLRPQIDDGVDPLRLVRELVGQPSPAPHVDLLDAAARVADDREELVERRRDGALFQVGVEDDHQLVAAHKLHLLRTGRPRSVRGRRANASQRRGGQATSGPDGPDGPDGTRWVPGGPCQRGRSGAPCPGTFPTGYPRSVARSRQEVFLMPHSLSMPHVHVPPVERHPLHDAIAVLTLVLGLAAALSGLSPGLHVVGAWVGAAGLAAGLYNQLTCESTPERFLTVTGMGLSFVGVVLGMAHGGWV